MPYNIGMNKTTDTRNLSPEQQEILRIKAVQAVFSGEKQAQVARMLGVSKWSVCQWVKQAEKRGINALKNQKRGTKTPQVKLKPHQAATICNIIRDKHPEQLKLPFVLWTRETIQQLILKKFNVRLELRTITDYLARWGMTPQRPVARAYQQNPQEVQKWMEQTYPSIQKRARKEKAIIFWGDEMSLRSDHVAGRGFSLKGKKPVITKTGNRFSSHMISAISNQGKLMFSVFSGSFVVGVFLDFLKRMVGQNAGRKVFLIVDGHPVHRAKKVATWLTEHCGEIEVFFIPAYSPELNPDELLNQELKATVFKHKRPSSQKEQDALLSKRLRSIQKNPQKIQNYFNGKLVKYAAA